MNLLYTQTNCSPFQGAVELYKQCACYISFFLELCLTSNVKCGTAESYKKHHFAHLFSVKHPVVLAVSTDKMNSYCVCHVNISNKTMWHPLRFYLWRENIFKIHQMCCTVIYFWFVLRLVLRYWNIIITSFYYTLVSYLTLKKTFSKFNDNKLAFQRLLCSGRGFTTAVLVISLEV